MTLHHVTVARDYSAPQMREYRYTVFAASGSIIAYESVLASSLYMAVARAHRQAVKRYGAKVTTLVESK